MSAKIIPNLWYENQAEEAANFYVSLFKNSKIKKVSYYSESGAQISGQPKGSVLTVNFEIEGQEFIALNGGPVFQFTPAVSFLVQCENQEEIDRLWNKLTEGGEEQPCGWLKDRFGVSWQIVPKILNEMLLDSNSTKSDNVMKALLQMKKIDIEALKRAYIQA